jgi:hypothetical protein
MSAATEKCPWCGSEIARAKFEEIKTKIREDEQRKHQKKEAEIEARYEQLYRDRIDDVKKKAGQAATTQADAAREKALEDQRALLDEAHQRALAAQLSKYSGEMEKFKKEIEDLHRKLKKQTPNEIGDGAEIDLFEALREEFGEHEDRFRRVKKGQEGADIHQEVAHKGVTCGLIIFDSKSRQAWQRRFASKLREDQVAAQADYAILATTVFPSGQKELCHEENIIVVSPARAIHLVRVLREALVKMHVRGLSQKQREQKTDELYRFIVSDQYSQKFAETIRLTDELLDVDVQEQKSHQNVWKKRGTALTKLKKHMNDLDSSISAIIEADSSETSVTKSALT